MRRGTTAMRKLLGVGGAVIVVIGLGAWGFETEYGSQGPGTIRESPDGTVRVYEFDEQQQDEEGHPVQVVVFEGASVEEAEAWVAQRSARSYWTPALIIGAGLVLILGAVVLWVRDRYSESDDELSP